MATSPTQAQNSRIAEVIEASSTGFVAQCYRLHDSPPLGALVRVGSEPAVYAAVCHVSTAGIDPSRRPVPLGETADEEDEVFRQHPQLPHLLRTTLEARIVGWRDGERTRQHLPASPPRVHAFVWTCGADEARTFGESLRFIALLLRGKDATPDEVVSATLRWLAGRHADPRAFLLRAAREAATLLAGDTARLNLLLRGIADGD